MAPLRTVWKHFVDQRTASAKEIGLIITKLQAKEYFSFSNKNTNHGRSIKQLPYTLERMHNI